jgi:hypothetical protein
MTSELARKLDFPVAATCTKAFRNNIEFLFDAAVHFV